MGERERILLVEDDPKGRFLVKRILRTEDHRIVGEAGSLEEVNGLVLEEHPTLAILDSNLPDGTGGEVAQILRERYGKDFKIIAHTADPLNIDWVSWDKIATKGEVDELCRIIREA